MKTINNIGRQAEGHTLYVEIIVNDDGTYTLADVQPWAIANQTVLVPWPKDGGAAFYSATVSDGDDDIVIEFIYQRGALETGVIIDGAYDVGVNIVVTLDASATEIKHVFAETVDIGQDDDDDDWDDEGEE